MNNLLEKKYERKHFIYSFVIPFLFVLACWMVHFYGYILDIDLARFGILPRKLTNIFGIIFTPFIHGDLSHLVSNTFPFLILGTGLFYFYPKIALRVILQIWVISGIGVWLMGRESYHIGASGLIYGFASFLVFGGILHKKHALAVISLVVIFLYGSIVWGIFPGQERISWEAHLAGFSVGILSAVWYAKSEEKPNTETEEIGPAETEFKQYSITDASLRNFFYTYKEDE